MWLTDEELDVHVQRNAAFQKQLTRNLLRRHKDAKKAATKAAAKERRKKRRAQKKAEEEEGDGKDKGDGSSSD